MQLDDLDRALLRALQADGRASLRSLADSTGSTAPTITRRMERLRSIGALADIQPVFVAERFELLTLIGSGVLDSSAAEQAMVRVAALPGVIEAHRMSGGRVTFVMRLARGADVSAELASIDEVADWHSLSLEPVISSRESTVRVPMESVERLRLTCTYCALPVHNDKHIVDFQGRLHPCCCPTCKRELEARFTRLVSLRDGAD